MERILKPERLDIDPNSSDGAKDWTHWFRTFKNFLGALTNPTTVNKVTVLTNFVSSKIFDCISECATYDEAILILKGLYLKPTNEIYTRHKLATRHQALGESLDEYLLALKTLSKDCNFKTVSAENNKEAYIRDAFISGLNSAAIRQRLLENIRLDLRTMFDQARSLETAQKSSEFFTTTSVSAAAAQSDIDVTQESLVAGTKPSHCFFCGYNWHPRMQCPAREENCKKC